MIASLESIAITYNIKADFADCTQHTHKISGITQSCQQPKQNNIFNSYTEVIYSKDLCPHNSRYTVTDPLAIKSQV